MKTNIPTLNYYSLIVLSIALLLLFTTSVRASVSAPTGCAFVVAKKNDGSLYVKYTLKSSAATMNHDKTYTKIGTKECDELAKGMGYAPGTSIDLTNDSFMRSMHRYNDFPLAFGIEDTGPSMAPDEQVYGGDGVVVGMTFIPPIDDT